MCICGIAASLPWAVAAVRAAPDEPDTLIWVVSVPRNKHTWARRSAINAWEVVRHMAAGVMAHQSALRDGEVLEVPDWGDASGGG